MNSALAGSTTPCAHDAVLLLVSLKKPMFNQQYFLICVPGFCLFLGRGAEALLERWKKSRISTAPDSN